MSIVNDKVALITGGCSGIGYEFVKVFLKNNAKGVAIVDINKTIGDQIITKLKKEFLTEKIIFKEADVTNKDKLTEAFQSTIDTFNQLDIVINNAGILNETNWEKVIATNCNGVVNGTISAVEDFLPKYKSGNDGIVLNISSIAALKPSFVVPIYSATKSFCLSFSRGISLKDVVAKNNIRVIIVCPGITDTNILKEDDELSTVAELVGKQSPQHVAEESILVIEKGNNGSVWVIESENPAVQMEL